MQQAWRMTLKTGAAAAAATATADDDDDALSLWMFGKTVDEHEQLQN